MEQSRRIAYGSEYKTEQINAALRAENPLETVPSMDTNGHGTFGRVACGSEDVEDNFIRAPFSEIAVVKLKEAKNLSAGILFYTGFCSGVSGE